MARRGGDRPKKRFKALHKALDGDGALPDEWLVSRIREEFGCTPLEAVNQPFDLVLTIMGLRGYARAKETVEQAQKQEDLPDHPMIKMVGEILGELAQEAMERRHGGTN